VFRGLLSQIIQYDEEEDQDQRSTSAAAKFVPCTHMLCVCVPRFNSAFWDPTVYPVKRHNAGEPLEHVNVHQVYNARAWFVTPNQVFLVKVPF
jgi:hypothetical protein